MRWEIPSTVLAGAAAAEAETDSEIPDLDSAGAVCAPARFPPPSPLAPVARDLPWPTMGMSLLCVEAAVAFAGIRSGGAVSWSDETNVVETGIGWCHCPFWSFSIVNDTFVCA